MIKELKRLIRLLAIKNKKCRVYSRCRLCGCDIYPKERYYEVDRWYRNRRIIRMCYCNQCVQSKEDVLQEVDTDSMLYGIAWVDSYKHFKKKDYTRYYRRKMADKIDKKE